MLFYQHPQVPTLIYKTNSLINNMTNNSNATTNFVGQILNDKNLTTKLYPNFDKSNLNQSLITSSINDSKSSNLDKLNFFHINQTILNFSNGTNNNEVRINNKPDEKMNNFDLILIAKPVQCPMLPGYFVLKCFRRHIYFTWIPPQEEVVSSMIKFKMVILKFSIQFEC